MCTWMARAGRTSGGGFLASSGLHLVRDFRETLWGPSPVPVLKQHPTA